METIVAIFNTPAVAWLAWAIITALAVLYIFWGSKPAGLHDGDEPEDYAGQLLDEYFADLDQARQDNALIQRWQHFGEAGDW